MATVTLAVDGVGVNDAFTLTAGASKVAAVASPDDDDTTRITGTGLQLQDLTFGTSAVLLGATISNVRITIRNRGAVSTTQSSFVLISGSSSSSQLLAQGVSYASQTYDFPLAPSGSAWDKAAIDAMFTRINSGDGTLVLTTVEATVTYTAGSVEQIRLPVLGVG